MIYDIIEISTKGNGPKWQNLFLARAYKGGMLFGEVIFGHRLGEWVHWLHKRKKREHFMLRIECMVKRQTVYLLREEWVWGSRVGRTRCRKIKQKLDFGGPWMLMFDCCSLDSGKTLRNFELHYKTKVGISCGIRTSKYLWILLIIDLF